MFHEYYQYFFPLTSSGSKPHFIRIIEGVDKFILVSILLKDIHPQDQISDIRRQKSELEDGCFICERIAPESSLTKEWPRITRALYIDQSFFSCPNYV